MAPHVLSFLVAHLLLGYGLVYIKPSSLNRFAVLSLIVFCCFDAAQSSIIQAIPGSSGVEYTIGFILHAANFLCIAKLEPVGSGTHPYRWVINQLFDPRWGLRLPHSFRTITRKREFLIRRIIGIAWLSVILYLHLVWHLNIRYDDLVYVPDGFIRRLSSVTLRETIIRVYVHLISVYIPYSSLRLAHCVVSVCAVLYGDDPARWPSLFGSMTEAYTIRNYYSRFWHQIMRKPFTTLAKIVVQAVAPARISKRAFTYLIILTTFAISAMFHTFTTIELSACSAYSRLRYFMSTAIAMVVEDVVLSFFRPTTMKNQPREAGASSSQEKPAASEKEQKHETTASGVLVENGTTHLPPLKWRVLGYCWVFLFETWAASKMVYSSHKCM